MEPGKRKNTAVTLLAVGLISFLLGVVSTRYFFGIPSHLPASVPAPGDTSPFTQAALRASPAVVNIRGEGLPANTGTPSSRVPHRDPFFQGFFGSILREEGATEPQVSLGSGVIIDRRGYILTNNHVIRGANRIIVRLSTREELKAAVVGRDLQTDLAVLQVQGSTEFPEAPLGNSDQLRVGEWALAIGNPFGLNHTLTVGVISATGRAEAGSPGYAHLIQTDASINPGNSGGPLLNVKGEVIGINTPIVTPGRGIGFANPINLAKRVAQDLIERGRVARGWLGIGVQALSGDVARSLRVLPGTGVLVSHVDPKGPGARSGLKPGDVITAIGERKVHTPEDLQRFVTEAPIGTHLSVIIQRHQQTLTLPIPVAEKPES